MPRKYIKKTDSVHLSPEHCRFIDQNWDKLTLKVLTQKTFSNDFLNGHSAEAVVIRDYIANRFDGARALTEKESNKGKAIALNSDQKTFIENNIKRMKTEEMTIHLFPDKYKTQKVQYTDDEYKAVHSWAAKIGAKNIDPNDTPVSENDYLPPKSLARAIPRINQYVTKNSTEENKKFLDANNLKPEEKKNIEALIGYMNTHRFVMVMNEYKKKIDRDLAESSYIRWCYGKDDLLEEEVDRYISLVEEVVDSAKIRRTIERFDREVEELLDGNAEDSRKMSMTLVEMINAQRDKLKESKMRQEKLLTSLVQTRSDRMKNRREKTNSLINMVELWKNSENRKKMVALAEKKRLLLSAEVERLSSMDALKVEIYGLDPQDLS